jgi:hypothetical protein
LGALPFFLYPRSGDFFIDVTYYELARSLLQRGWYGYNCRPETLLPPGCAVLLALVCRCFGDSYVAVIRSMAVSATLFLLAAYPLLRREVGRRPAAAICLLLGTWPFLFNLSTKNIFSDLPYAFVSTLALVAARRLDGTVGPRSRIALGGAFGFLLGCSLLLRSAALALLAGLAVWLALAALIRQPNWRRRVTTFAPLLAFGIAVQALWMGWGTTHEKLVWPLGGYPGSYTSQLTLKSGNNPELGRATPADIPLRVGTNAVEHARGLLQMLLRGFAPDLFDAVWYSPLIVGTILLILLGLRYSPWTDASGLLQWYFVFYEAMYLLWPWELELRFLLPILPLACVYLWRGGWALAELLYREPRKVGLGGLGVSLLMAAYPGYLVLVQDQGKKAALEWLFLALCSAGLAWVRVPQGRVLAFLSRPLVPRAAAVSVLVFLVAAGLFTEVHMGVTNINFDLTQTPHYADIEAGQWLGAHADSNAVVMARKEDLVYHYSGHKVIWFPPSTDPDLLMNGIRKYHVEWVVVVSRETSYFLPADDVCFDRLVHTHPDAFRLVHEGPHNQVYRVTLPDNRVSSNARDRE